MRDHCIVVCNLLLVVAAAQAEPLSPAGVKDLLARIRERRAAAPHVQGDFQEEKVIRLMNKPIVSAGNVWFQAPDKFRREVKGNSPSITVSDGRQLWIYYPNFKSAEHYSLGKSSPLDSTVAAINSALRSEEHTSELQSRFDLVCRLLLEKKKKKK